MFYFPLLESFGKIIHQKLYGVSMSRAGGDTGNIEGILQVNRFTYFSITVLNKLEGVFG